LVAHSYGIGRAFIRYQVAHSCGTRQAGCRVFHASTCVQFPIPPGMANAINWSFAFATPPPLRGRGSRQLRSRQGSLLPAASALRKEPSSFGLIAREQPLLVCGTWQRSATPTAGTKTDMCLSVLPLKHFPARRGECSRGAEPVKAKPSGLGHQALTEPAPLHIWFSPGRKMPGFRLLSESVSVALLLVAA